MPIDLVIDDRDGGKSDGEDFVGSSGNNVDQVTRRRLLQTQLLAVIRNHQNSLSDVSLSHLLTRRNRPRSRTPSSHFSGLLTR